MKTCQNCHKTYDDDANFCPEEGCATPEGPRRLVAAVTAAPVAVKERFEIAAQVGGSRTGAVHRANDTQSGTVVAYKLVSPALANNPTAFARIEREFKQLLRIQSPHIVSVADVGKNAQGQLYVAMEWCEAHTLADVLRKGPVALDRAKQIIAQIGQGLLEAQKAGLVHRDLAPKNVLMTGAGDAKLINFPLAVPIDDKLSGVAEYGSPEQGQGKPVDQRSNTYSLACILYHLVTGEPPFSGPDPVAVFALHTSSPPLAPSQRRSEANLPPDADKSILKALDKNSSRRHLTLRLFLNEIEALQPVAPVAAVAGGGRDVGFAKTMLFAGGQNDIQDMVQKAIASRQASKPAETAAAPVAAPEPTRTPAPVAVSAAAVAASRLTPPPVTPNPANAPLAQEIDPVAAARKKAAAAGPQPAPAPAGGKGSAFRETLWFKKGDVEQMVAEAKAKAVATGQDAAVVAAPDEDVRPIEDRYRDDGTLTTDDRKKFSLRTGATATSLPVAGSSIGGDKMSAAEMMEEMGAGKKTGVYIAIAVVLVVVVGAILLMMGGGKKEHKTEAPAAPAAAIPAPPPAAPVAAAPTPAPAPAPVNPPDPVVKPVVAANAAASKKTTKAKPTAAKKKKVVKPRSARKK